MGSPRPSSQSLAFPKWKPQKTPKSMRSRQGPEEKVTEGHSGDSSDATLEGDIFPADAEWWDSPATLPM